MPEKRTIERARRGRREGKAPTTQAGEFVREEIHHIREGKHGARSAKQAIAIGLSKARRAGVDLPPPSEDRTSEKTRRSAERAYETGQGRKPARRRPKVAKAVQGVMKREGREAASREALSEQARSAARRRSGARRSAASKKAARSRSPAKRSAAARKAARTRAARQ